VVNRKCRREMTPRSIGTCVGNRRRVPSTLGRYRCKSLIPWERDMVRGLLLSQLSNDEARRAGRFASTTCRRPDYFP